MKIKFQTIPFLVEIISVLGIGLSGLIIPNQTVQAQILPGELYAGGRYVPPSGGNPKSPQGSGSRSSCDADLSEINLLLLIPTDHVGETTAKHPTFSWYLSRDVAVPVKFTLVKPGVHTPLFVKQLDTAKQGINQISIPEDAPELEENIDYRWTVSLLCNPNRPNDNIFAQAWIKRKAISPELTNQLNSAKTDSDRFQIYAAAGFWFDALNSLYQAKIGNPNDQTLKEDWVSLLQQVGLNYPQLTQE